MRSNIGKILIGFFLVGFIVSCISFPVDAQSYAFHNIINAGEGPYNFMDYAIPAGSDFNVTVELDASSFTWSYVRLIQNPDGTEVLALDVNQGDIAFYYPTGAFYNYTVDPTDTSVIELRYVDSTSVKVYVDGSLTIDEVIAWGTTENLNYIRTVLSGSSGTMETTVSMPSGISYWHVTFDSSCWTNGAVYYDWYSSEDVLLDSKVPVNATNYDLWTYDGSTIYVYGVADAGYYFAGSEIDFDSEEDDSSQYSGYYYTIIDDGTVSVTFSAWPETFDEFCPVAVTSDGHSSTVMYVSFNGDDYLFGGGGWYFYNFSVPYNTAVTFSYSNVVKAFSGWNFDYIGNTSGTIDTYSDSDHNNPTVFNIAYISVDTYDIAWNISAASYYIGPTGTPSPTASPTPSTDYVTPFLDSFIPVIVPLAFLLVPAFLVMVFVKKSILAFVAGLTAGAVLGYAVMPAYVPLYAIVMVLLVDAGVVFAVSRNGGGG